MRDLRNKVAAITGAGSGIGRALALALTREGMHLALSDRDGHGLEETTRLARDAGATRVSTHVVDVADAAAVDAYARAANEAHGGVDVLVNNAGVALYGSVMEMSLDEFHWLMNINFWGVVHGVRAFLPTLLARPEASIVNMSSLFGLWGPPGQAAYAASKFAVRGYSESLRAELTGSVVHVVTVHPAGVATAIARASRIAASANASAAQKESELFDRRFLTMPAQKAAAIILDGIRRNRDRVLVGAESVRIDVLNRVLGPRAARLINRRIAFDVRRNRRVPS